MDIHLPEIFDHEAESVLEHSYHTQTASSNEHELHGNGLLEGHCSHSSAHTSALVYSIDIQTLDIPSIFYTALRFTPYIHTQTPPIRPPKTII